MRDAFHIGGLFLVFAFLMTRFPADLPIMSNVEKSDTPPFASFITLSPAAYAAWQEAARTSWQIRSQARGRPLIGRLDSDIPLLTETLPPPMANALPLSSSDVFCLPPPDIDTYAFLPPTVGAAMPEFAPPAQRMKVVDPPADHVSRVTFEKDEMLSIENSRTLKEIMK